MLLEGEWEVVGIEIVWESVGEQGLSVEVAAMSHKDNLLIAFSREIKDILTGF